MSLDAAPTTPASRSGTLVDVVSMATFVAVINAASFTEAARRLGTSKSVVSRRVSDMEVQLRARLIDRTAMRVNPTEVGAVYYSKCVRILESIEAANDFVASFHGDIRGSVRISIPRYLSGRTMGRLLTEFADTYPELRLEVDVDEHESSLHDTGFDVALRVGRLADSSMVARTISYSRKWLCASTGYLRARGAPTSPEDLEQHDCLLYSLGDSRMGWYLISDGHPKLFRVRDRLRSACYLQLFEAVRLGLGVGLLPGYLIADAVTSGEIQVLLPEAAPSPSPVSLVYPSSRKASQKVQTLISFLAERIPNPPPWEDAIEQLALPAREGPHR